MLSITSQYALRAMAHLAGLPQGESITGVTLAGRTAVPRNYLTKILHILGSQGNLVEAVRGTGGGYRLARKPEKIRLIEIVRAVDPDAENPPCLLGLRKTCSDSNPCYAHSSWRPAKNAYLDFLKETPLSQIAP